MAIGERAGRTQARALRAGIWLILSLALAGCAGGGHAPRYGRSGPPRSYEPPGPPSDPWGPYVREAAGRFGVAETWIREVMRQESGGREYLGGGLTTSPAGAMGLMQVMPATYDELRRRYGLGDDPYEPHDNIMAGTAYIRELSDRYGSPGFLAAYNAGPNRLDDYLATGNPLPAETVNYVASIAPRLGGAASGPLSAYSAGADQGGGAPPPPMMPVRLARAPAPTQPPLAEPDPTPGIVLAAAPGPAYRLASAALPTPAPAADRGGWAIQVGAFSSPAQARAVADGARSEAMDLLGGASIAVGAAAASDGAVLYRARLVDVAADAADAACSRLASQRLQCVVIPPGAW